MAQAKAQSRNRTRRARSADQASAYMEEKLTEALRAGKAPKLDSRKMEVRLPLGPRKNVVLVKADGTVTDEGKHVYREMGVPAPSIYPYEQGLINGKWVKNFAGAASTKTLVVGRGGKPTAKGENYFKYNRDEYETSFPVRIARVPRKHEWRLDPTPLENRTEYQTRHIDQDHFGEPILALTVGKLGKNPIVILLIIILACTWFQKNGERHTHERLHKDGQRRARKLWPTTQYPAKQKNGM